MVTKRCRLSWLTKSAFEYEPKCGGRGRGICRVSVNEYTAVLYTGAQINFGDLTPYLKVPKREIFDRSDFPDFYTIKSLRVGDFGVKIIKNLKIFRGSFRGAKFLTRMLSLFLRRFFFPKLGPKNFFFCVAIKSIS